MNWISVKDKMPSSTEKLVLACINNEIYIGNFYAYETYNVNLNGEKENYKKTISFHPVVWLDNNRCNNCLVPGPKCGDGDQCIDCCEKDADWQQLALAFDFELITHWMTLPEKPNE